MPKKRSNRKKLDTKGKIAHTAPMRIRVRAYRYQLGITQAELAKELGVSERSIKNFERGRGEPIPLFREKINEWAASVEEGQRMAEESLS